MNGELEKLTDKYDEELPGGVSRKKMMDLSLGYEYDVESNARYWSEEGRRRFRQGRTENLINLEGATDKRVIDEGEKREPRLASIEEGSLDLNSPAVDEHGLRRLEQIPDRFRGNDELEDPRQDRRRYIDRKRYSAPNYLLDGPSRNYSESSYGHGEQCKNGCSRQKFDNREYGGDNLGELLRKIDELKDQLSRSRMADKHMENHPYYLRNAHNHHYYGSEDWISDSSSGKYRPSIQYPFPVQTPASSSSTKPYAEPSAHRIMHPMGRRPRIPNPYQRFLDIPHNALSYHYENSASPQLLEYGLKTTNTSQVQSENLQLHARWASEVDSEVSSLAYLQRPRLQPKTGSQHCRSVGGGAPFITCENCFGVLQVPKRVSANHGMQRKMRCGSCSTMIAVDISSKNFLVSIPEEKSESTLVDGNDDIKLIEGNTNAQGHTNRASLAFSSEDYDRSGYDLQSMDREPIPRLTNQQVVAGTKGKLRTSSDTPEEVAAHNFLAGSRRSSSPTEFSMKGKPSPPPAGSSLQEYFEYSNKYHRGNHFKKGNRSSDQETLMPNIAARMQKYIKDASEATELELSSNEYGITESSLDSGVPRNEGDQLRLSKPAEAFFAGNVKDNLWDSEKSNLPNEHGKDNVTVNGHLIPNELIKKAEKVAGPVQPGNYWYDSRAGFWGVFGGPCLGIIPPSIEEFKYPMPENCAAGNTSVYVNGRELHQKDLSLLVSRGLPNDKNRYYNVKISGRVIDEMTGEELESLGKLAPTVSRVKRGFGMKAPKEQH